jgi:hypothetical protein
LPKKEFTGLLTLLQNNYKNCMALGWGINCTTF